MTAVGETISKYGPSNTAAWEGLIDALASGESIALVGAGLSMRVGYPSWSGLLDMMRARARELDLKSSADLDDVCRGDDKLVVALHLKNVLGKEHFESLIEATFSPRTPAFDNVHRSLVALPFRHYLTTNYDESIQTAIAGVRGALPASVLLGNHEASQRFLESLSNVSLRSHVIHLHGSVTQPGNIVLTLDDYNQNYLNDRYAAHFLRTVLTVRTVVFIGFSMTDEDLMFHPRDLSALIGSGAPRHFALVGAPPLELVGSRRAALNARFRVEPVFYEPAGEHKCLLEVLEKLRGVVEPELAKRAVTVPIAAVQGALEEVLGGKPEVAATVRNRVLARVVRGGAIVGGHQTGEAEDVRGPLDAEIDAIYTLIDSGLPQRAIVRYRSMLKSTEPGLSQRVQYRLHANIGNALLRCDRPREAAESYLVAVGHYKKSRDARALEVLAYILLKEAAQARALAERLCIDEPQFARGHALRLRTWAPEGAFATLESSVPDGVQGDAEVAAALAEAAERNGLHDRHEFYLRRAVEAAPRWVDVIVALASALISRAGEGAEIDVDTGPVAATPGILEEGEVLLKRALELSNELELPEEVAHIYHVRAALRRLGGRPEDARGDLGRAYMLSPLRSEIAAGEALARDAEGDADGAIECLEKVSPDGILPERDALLAFLRGKRGAPNDRTRALELLSSWRSRLNAIGDQWLRGDVCRQTVRLLIAEARAPEARAVVMGVPDGVIAQSIKLALCARVELGDAREAEARRLLREAQAALTQEDAWYQRQEVSGLAEELGEWQIAFACLRDIVPKKRFNSDSSRLVRAAYLAKEESFILQYGHTLRSEGVHAWGVYEAEVDILVRHREPERALVLLGDWLAIHEEHDAARVTRAGIARQAGRHDIADDDEGHLPPVGSVGSAAMGAQVVFVLRHGSSPESGVEYAYELWRRFPDEQVARNALVGALLDPGAPQLNLQRPTKVEQGAAVRIQPPGEVPYWIVIETGPDPSATRREFSPAHPLAKALLGLGAGEEGTVGGRVFSVLQVESRLVFRANEVLQSLEDLYPAEALVRRFKVPTDAPQGGSPQEVLGDVWKELEAQEATRKRLEGVQQEKGAPLAMIARRLGRSVFETVQHFASRTDLTVRCSTGRPEEWQEATKHLAGQQELVLDGTAIATMTMLGLLPSLSALSHRLTVPRSVVDELRRLLPAAGGRRAPAGVIGAVDGKVWFHEFTAEEVATETARLQGVIAEVTNACTIVGGSALLGLEPRVREGLVSSLGEGTADAIAIARERRAVLWTDDLGVGSLAVSLGAASRVWTNVVLRMAGEQERVSAEAVRDAAGLLVLWRYEFTGITPRDAVELWAKSQWRIDHGVAQAVYRQVLGTPLNSANNRMIVLVLLAGVWRACGRERDAGRLILGVLEGIARDRSGREVSRSLCRMPSGVLDMSESKCRRLRNLVRKWRGRSLRPSKEV